MSWVITLGAEPARIDIDVNAGEPIDFTEPVYDGAGAAVDVTGWTLAAQIRRDRGSPVLYAPSLSAVAPTVVNGVTTDPGGIRVQVSGAATALWPDWRVPVARWDLWLTPPASEPDIVAAGWVRTTSTVTH